MSSWTQPLCGDCWVAEERGRRPDPEGMGHGRYGTVHEEVCCMCGQTTTLGIYVRKDPDRVPYPRVIRPERDGAYD